MGRTGVAEERSMLEHGDAECQREQAYANNYRDSRQSHLTTPWKR